MKTNELTGPALDWAVATAWFAADQPWREITLFQGTCRVRNNNGSESKHCFEPSTAWKQAGPIIEREFIELTVVACGHTNLKGTGNTWQALKGVQGADAVEQFGPTPLIAAMRCYVTSRLGDNVDIPNELAPSRSS